MTAAARTKGEEFRRGWRVLLASCLGTGTVPLADRYGSRQIVLAAQVALKLAFTLLALLPHSLPLFYAGYGLGGVVEIAVTVGRPVSGYSLDVVRGPVVAFASFAVPALACLMLSISGIKLWLCALAAVVVGLAGGVEHDILTLKPPVPCA